VIFYDKILKNILSYSIFQNYFLIIKCILKAVSLFYETLMKLALAPSPILTNFQSKPL
jgi:hypothetical protein